MDIGDFVSGLFSDWSLPDLFSGHRRRKPRPFFSGPFVSLFQFLLLAFIGLYLYGLLFIG